jgi:hypothetical protein
MTSSRMPSHHQSHQLEPEFGRAPSGTTSAAAVRRSGGRRQMPARTKNSATSNGGGVDGSGDDRERLTLNHNRSALHHSFGSPADLRTADGSVLDPSLLRQWDHSFSVEATSTPATSRGSYSILSSRSLADASSGPYAHARARCSPPASSHDLSHPYMPSVLFDHNGEAHHQRR